VHALSFFINTFILYMDVVKNRQDYANALSQSVSHLSEGYWVTLNAISKNEISFNSHLQELANRLNIFCYGNKYRNGLKRFEIRGAIQLGHAYEGLHTHIVVLKNGHTDRTDLEVEEFIRTHWYRLVGAQGCIWGSLVDFQPVSDVAARIRYAVRDFRPNFDQRNQLIYL
jgi:hypothetical protein